MVWRELRYAPEQYKADGTTYPEPQLVAVKGDMLAHYQKLIQLRNNQPLLQTGAFTTLLADDEKEVLAFRRHENGKDKGIVVVLNNSAEQQEVRLEGLAYKANILYQSKASSLVKNTFLLPAKAFVILLEQ
jgi:glycosidase